MRVYVVTGATSFIGAPLVKALSSSGALVYAIIRPNSKNVNNIHNSNNIKIVECDMKDYDILPSKISDKCDAFYHIAWNGTRVPERNNRELQHANYLNSLKLYNSAVKLGCEAFFSIGSQAEYGACFGKVDESFPVNPKSEYGKAKLETYREIKRRAYVDKIKFGWIRIFSAYGHNDYKNSLVSMCIKKMANNEDVELTSGNQSWNYIFIDDVIKILCLLDLKKTFQNEVFNVCSDDTRPIRDYVYELKQILKSSSRLVFGSVSYNEREGVVGFDPINKKIKTILGFKSFTPFSDGIAKVLESMEQHNG